MIVKKSLVFGFVFAIILLSLASVSAQKITASIGNSRMILKMETGESLRKSVLIRNVNDIPVTINVSASGELADSIKLDENSFQLSPGEEKKIYFTIKATKEGTTESKIDVRFTPEKGSGVGLSSQVIVIASGKGTSSDAGNSDTAEGTQESENTQDNLSTSESSQGSASGAVSGVNTKWLNSTSILIISTAILLIVFIILIVYAKKARSKKRLGRPRE